MRFFFCFAIAATLAACAPRALADTMYKCIGANGKAAYSSQPCQGQAREARQFAVPPPESEADSSERLKRERNTLRRADMQFRQRQAVRNFDNGSGRTYIANVPSSTGSGQRQAEQERQSKERAEAARLNAAHIGNCSMRRPEANCL